jgi:MSHA pilin protein MshA
VKVNRSTRQHGFTLIELILVIVILGVLAAVAVPRFIDLSSEAEVASVRAQAGALTSASSMNFAAFKAGRSTADPDNPNHAVVITGAASAVCVDATLNRLLSSDAFPGDFTATADSGDCDDDAFVRCLIKPTNAGTDADSEAIASIYCTK